MRFRIGFIGLMLVVLGLTGSLRAFKPVQAALSNPNTSRIVQTHVPQGAARINEQESNNTLATANPIMASRAIIRGIIWSGDVDMYRIELAAGDRLNVATMTSAATHSSTDTVLSLYALDGTSLIELDDDDGTFGSLSSVISSVPVTITGTYYIRINAFLATAQVRYYDLYVRIFSEATTAEQEPNDVVGTAQVLPASGAVEGSLSATTDVDLFKCWRYDFYEYRL
ncbi:PPC domain-containing protein [Herpetosiphon sp.]|uniref:PPC domain-containing protein n=1 Tax=Herpetosiphon sp. TaxID=71864 RepID=UPI0003220185|nr:PPC domain-containing protein [Herpetosiphon sp.]